MAYFVSIKQIIHQARERSLKVVYRSKFDWAMCVCVCVCVGYF